MIIIFAVIVLLVWIFSRQNFTKETTVTSYRRQAISPPIKFSHLQLYNQLGNLLPQSQWHNKWVLLYITSLPCKKECVGNLHKLQEIYRNYGGKSHLDIMVATFSAAKDKQLEQLLSHQYTHFVHVYLQKDNFLKIFAGVKSKREAVFTGTFYLINPKGQIIMNYPSSIAPKVIKFDLS